MGETKTTDSNLEDDNIWRIADAAGNIVFVGQGVRYVCQAEEQPKVATEIPT